MLQVRVDLSHLHNLAADADQAALDLSSRRIALRVASYVQQVWQLAAMGTRLPGMVRTVYDPTYAESIRTIIGPEYVDVETDYYGAMTIQHGRPPVDLKPGLLAGQSAHLAKDGHRYAIVPLRHSTPGTSPHNGLPPLPNDVYRAALRGNKIVSGSEMGMRGIQPGWSLGPWSGLRREVAPGGKKGAYYTYRSVSERSSPTKFVLPALPPVDVRQSVWDYVQPEIQKIIHEELGLGQ